MWQIIIGGIALLWAGLKKIAPDLIVRLLAAFGLSIATNEYLLPELQSLVTQYAGGLTAEAANFLGAIGLGQAISMVLSAYTVRAASKVFLSKAAT